MTELSKDQDLERSRESSDGQTLTNNQGVRVGDDQNSLRAGSRGPSLLEDFQLREKITHFDHERIPERVVHARGTGAHGFFQVYEPQTELTMASFLQDPVARTPVFVRFSTVAGSRGSADTVRDVRGFSTKFYTEDGVFDLVGNNIPVFFIQDALKFPDVIHAVKPEPHNEIPQAASAHDTFWDFVWLTPESTHMIMWHLSDRAIPRSFSMMEGFGVNTFRLVNAHGVARFVKFHWKPLLGVHSLVWDEAQKIAGKDPDFHRRDLWEAIERGNFPEFEFGIQVIEEADELSFAFDPLDATKIWPEELVPVRRIGKLTLNRNPDNFFAETEQVAFCTSHVVPGIDFSNDPLLQGRLFSYLDTQLTRLGGPNFAELPINRPLAPVHTNQRDGFMRHTINQGRTSYSPNSLGGGCPMQAGTDMRAFISYAERVDGQKIRERSDSFRDHFSQATLFWNSQSEAEKEHIVQAFHFELGKVVTLHVRQHVIELLMNVDQELARTVAAGIGVAVPRDVVAANASLEQGWDQFGVTSRPGVRRDSGLMSSAPLSMANTVKGKVTGRKVAMLVAAGFNATELHGMKAALEAAGVKPEVVAPSLGQLASATGSEVAVDKTFATSGSVLYDAVYVPGGARSSEALRIQGDAVHFVNEAFKHCKAIAASSEGLDLLMASDINPDRVSRSNGRPDRKDGLPSDSGIVTDGTASDLPTLAQHFIEAIGQHRNFARLNKERVPA